MGRVRKSEIAESIPFDNDANGFTAEDVQAAIEEAGSSASPGFNFGKSGGVSVNDWLRGPGNVQSQRAGIPINITNPVITTISVSNRNTETYTVTIFEHDGNRLNETSLGSVSVTASTGATVNVNISATQGKQLSARMTASSTGNVRDIVVSVLIKGT